MAFLFNPLHYALHLAVRWDFARRFDFARNDPFVAVARSEVRSLAGHVPIVVVLSATGAVPVVPLDSAHASRPPLGEDFRWHHGQAPTALRYHPFRSIADSTTGAPILAVAEDRETVHAEATNGFFDGQARPLPIVSAVLRRLRQLELEKAQIRAAAAALAGAGLLSVLPDLVDRRGRTPFHTLDNAAFAALSGQQLSTLGDFPHHAFMLAVAMTHSQRWLPTPPPPSEPVGAGPAEPSPAADAFAFEDESFVLNFDD